MTASPEFTVKSRVCWLSGTKAWACFTTSNDLVTGVQRSSWSLWKTWRGAMQAAARERAFNDRLNHKTTAKRAAEREFERSYARRVTA